MALKTIVQYQPTQTYQGSWPLSLGETKDSQYECRAQHDCSKSTKRTYQGFWPPRISLALSLVKNEGFPVRDDQFLLNKPQRRADLLHSLSIMYVILQFSPSKTVCVLLSSFTAIFFSKKTSSWALFVKKPGTINYDSRNSLFWPPYVDRPCSHCGSLDQQDDDLLPSRVL